VLWLVTWIVVFAVATVGVVASVNSLRFRKHVEGEVRALFARSSEPFLVDGGRLEKLPHPVRVYLTKAIGSRELPVRTVRLRHGGVFRTKLDGPWLAIRGEQYFTTTAPGFVWWGRIRMAPGLWVDARDRCVAGAGNMRISLESTFTLGDSRGPEMDQGALLRLLGEMVWFPTSLADDRYVSWTAVDATRAQGTLRVNGREVTALFEFGEDGLPGRISADRYREVSGGKAILTPWSGEYRDYRQVEGLIVPHELTSFYSVDSQRIPILRFEVIRLEYDATAPF
jgi:hypothetical protein